MIAGQEVTFRSLQAFRYTSAPFLREPAAASPIDLRSPTFPPSMKLCWPAIFVLLFTAAGCGTSKWTDTGRSATEQLLITDAMDRAVSSLDFRALAGKTAYVESSAVKKLTDSEYLISCLRQHMLASGCVLKDDKAAADYIVEVRAGAIGTDRNDVLYGIPAVNIPTAVPVTGVPSQIPEMPIIKKTDQRAVVKLSLFAYNQKTGRPIWQSGAVPEESKAKAVWVLGAGPFQRGTIYNGTEFAGDRLSLPLIDLPQAADGRVSVADEAHFAEPPVEVPPEEKVETAVAASDPQKESPKAQVADGKSATVVPAGHNQPSDKVEPSAPSPPSEPAGAAPADRPDTPPAQPPVTVSQVSTGTPAGGSRQPSAYSPNDMAALLSAFAAASEPELLVQPVGVDGTVTVPQPIPASRSLLLSIPDPGRSLP